MSGKFGRITETGGDFEGGYFKPYSELAEIYDRVMDHVDYISWAGYISSIFRRHRIDVKNILEIACGTGSLSVELYKLGYSVTGMDVSPHMLAKASEKFKKHDIPVRLFSSSMKSIPLNCQFDAVLCIYDSINYLTDTRDFIRTVGEVSKVTRSGGLFIFDVCTVKNSEMFFSQNSMVENLGDIRYERICKFDSVRRIQENHFIIRKFGKRYVENHYQKIYRLDEIRAMIAGNNFDEIGIYDDLSFLPGTENSERVHFVLKKRDKVKG